MSKQLPEAAIMDRYLSAPIKHRARRDRRSGSLPFSKTDLLVGILVVAAVSFAAGFYVAAVIARGIVESNLAGN